MPTNNRARLHDRQRIANFRKQPIETNEYHSVHGAEREFLWSRPPQNVDLLPQCPNFCLKRCPRPDQIDDHPSNEPAKVPHLTTALPDSPSTASRIRFATGTVGGQCAPCAIRTCRTFSSSAVIHPVCVLHQVREPLSRRRMSNTDSVLARFTC